MTKYNNWPSKKFFIFRFLTSFGMTALLNKDRVKEHPRANTSNEDSHLLFSKHLALVIPNEVRNPLPDNNNYLLFSKPFFKILQNSFLSFLGEIICRLSPKDINSIIKSSVI